MSGHSNYAGFAGCGCFTDELAVDRPGDVVRGPLDRPLVKQGEVLVEWRIRLLLDIVVRALTASVDQIRAEGRESIEHHRRCDLNVKLVPEAGLPVGPTPESEEGCHGAVLFRTAHFRGEAAVMECLRGLYLTGDVCLRCNSSNHNHRKE